MVPAFLPVCTSATLNNPAPSRHYAGKRFLAFALLALVFLMTVAPHDTCAQSLWNWRNNYGAGIDRWGADGRWFDEFGAYQTLTGIDQDIQLVIDGSQDATQNNDVTGAGVRGVTFGGASRTVHGNLLKIGIGGTGTIENSSGLTQTLNLTLSNSTTNGLEINPENGLLNISNIHLGNNFVDMSGNNTVHYGGDVSGSAVMTWKTNIGVPTAIFSASNTLTSSFNIERGHMILSNASAYVGTNVINIGGAGNSFFAELQLGAGAAQTNNIGNSIDIKSVSGHATNRSIASLSSSGTNVVTGRVTNDNSGLSAKLFIASGGTLRFSNAVAGSGGFYMDGGSYMGRAGGGTLELSSSNTITGGFYINAGTIKLSGTSANAGDGALHIGASGASNNASLLYSGTGGGITASNTLTVNSGTGSRTIISENTNTSGVNTFLGPATLNTNLTVSNASGGEFRFGNTLSGTGGIIKTGSGTVTLSGTTANTYTGLTKVSAGTLNLSKTAEVNAIAGAVEVKSTAVLLLSASNQVDSTEEGDTVTLSGGTIRRGGNVSEVFGNLTVSTAASFLDYGASNATGTLRFGSYTHSVLLNVENFLPGNKLQFASGFNSALLPTGGSLSNANFSFSNGFTTGTEDGYFTITAIPEPSTYVAAAGLFALFLWPVRRRIIKDLKSIIGLRPTGRERIEAYRNA